MLDGVDLDVALPDLIAVFEELPAVARGTKIRAGSLYHFSETNAEEHNAMTIIE